MGYSTRLFDKAMARIDARRRFAEDEAEQRRDEIVSKCPRIGELEIAMRRTGADAVTLVMANPGDMENRLKELKKQNLAYQAEIKEWLKRCSLPEDWFSADYKCKKCSDKGFIDGKMCECLKKLLRDETIKELNALTPLKLSDFDSFELDFYPDEPDENGVNPRKCMEFNLKKLKQYAKAFGEGSGNLLLYGGTGLGKTHLSLAVARDVIEKGYGVVYGSAQNLMNRLEREKFGKDSTDSMDEILGCDLLILDDLGTEFTTQFISSTVYNIVNSRVLSGKPTIISTNLDEDELEEKYTQRILSRLTGNYAMYPFAGRDIRQLKKGR